MSDQQGGFLPFSSPNQSPDIAVAQNAAPSVTVPVRKTIKEDDTITGGTQQWSPQNPPVPAYPVPFSGGEHVDTITGGTEAWKPPILPDKQISKGEAAVEAAKYGVTAGFSPALQGAADAGADFLRETFHVDEETAKNFPPATRALFGGAKMFYDWVKGDQSPVTMEAFRRGRYDSQKTLDLANDQQKFAYVSGLLSGSAMIPFGGEANLATMPERIAQGMKQGAVIGGVSGIGEGVSRGEDIPSIAMRGAEGTGTGAAIGGVGGAVLGPRTGSSVPTSGQKAAITADELLDRPLPKGVTADSQIVRDATAILQSYPIAGGRISGKVAATQEAAGEHIAGISDTMTAGNQTRAVAGPIVEKGLSNDTGVGPPGVLQKNKASQNFAYDQMRAFLPQSGEVPISSYGLGTPATDFVINELAAKRFRAGLDPFAGLEQFRNLGGASFNGLQRARSESYAPSLVTRTNPGFDAGEYKRIYDALTRDMHTAVFDMANTHGGNGNAAVAAWKAADAHFGRVVEENQEIEKLLQGGGEKAISRLIGAAKEKGGDYQLLAKLKSSMNPADWNQIGGHALGDMGRDGDKFSLQKFSTAWGKMSDDAKVLLFAPNHLRNINDIVDMAGHIQKSLEKTNRSHTAPGLIVTEILGHLGELVGGMALGHVSGGTIAETVGGGASAVAVPFGVGWMLGNPANASAIRAYLAARSGAMVQPSPARTAMVNMTSRNMANTLDIPLKQVQRLTQDTTPDQPQTAEQPATKQKAGTQ